MPSTRHHRAATVGAALALLAGAAAIAAPGTASAATFDVTSNADSGAGSLRAAIADAAANPGPDVVRVQDGLGTIVLTSGTLSYGGGGTLTVQGNGVTVDGNGDGVFNNGSGDAVTLEDMTITGAAGNAVNTSSADLTISGVTFEGNDRAANANSGALTIVDSIVRGHTTGGDVINTNTGPLTITRSQIVDNAGNAGNTNSGTISITDSLIARNANRGFNTASGAVQIVRSTIADNGGRGFNAASSEMDVIESTITGHTTDADGAGINVGSGTIRVVNSTITGNTATGNEGGGIALGTGTVVLAYATVVGNGADDAANILAGELRTFGSVIAEPTSGGNCSVRITVSSGYNDSDGTCGLTEATDTEDGAPTQLGPLADNGGPTPTLLPAESSPLVDAIPVAACGDGPVPGIATDQRGVARPQRGGCDIGSVELEEEPPPTTTTTAPTTSTTATVAVAVVATPRFTG